MTPPIPPASHHTPKRSAYRASLTAEDGSVEMMDITPEFAEELLRKRHPHQRPLKEHYVADLAKAMTDGRWRWTADAIRLDKDLLVIDGQHRLAAAVKAKYTFHDAIIATVTGEDAILSIDQNRPRTLNDMRATRGHRQLSRTVSGAIIAEAYDWSQWRGCPRELQLRTIEECAFVDDLLVLTRGDGQKSHRRATITVGSLSGALRVLQKHREDGMKFFEAVFSMTPVIDGKEYQIIRTLYTFLAESKSNTSSSEARTIEHAHKSISAFNHWRKGSAVGRLLWKGGPPPAVVD